jgi:hypothetical protein
MKNLLFLFSFVMMTNSGFVFGQTEQGTLLLGGNASYLSSDGSTALLFNPNVGIFLGDNLAIGMNVRITSLTARTNYAISPFFRPYFGASSGGKFFAQGTIGVTGVSRNIAPSKKLTWSTSLGYAIFLNQSVALEFGPTYSKIANNPGLFTIDIGVQAHFKYAKRNLE